MCKPILKVLKSLNKNNVGLIAGSYEPIVMTCPKCHRTYQFDFSMKKGIYIITRWFYLHSVIEQLIKK